jgi:GNAT superfamily N-acetyltransferase
MKIQKATKNNYQEITSIEDKSFGVHIIPEESELIIEKGYGDIYIAYEDELPIAYLAVLYKEYDKDTEDYLQPIIKDRKDNGEKVMHDDVLFDSNQYVYFHLLGVISEYQSKGIGQELLRYVKAQVLAKFPEKKLKACIRINNLPSIAVCMKELGMYMESIKENNWDIFGSIETNFNAIGSKGNKPVFKNVVEDMVVNLGDDIPDYEQFLIPVENGEEDMLIDGKLKEMLIDVFKEGYVIKGLVREGGKSYFYLLM